MTCSAKRNDPTSLLTVSGFDRRQSRNFYETFPPRLADTSTRLRIQDLARTFRTIVDEFRHRYVVSYTPRGVSKTGWHRLDVHVKRKGASVKARPGYQAGS